MEDTGSSTSSDEECIEIIEYIERQRQYRARDNQYTKYNCSEFRDRFRLTKENVKFLVQLIGGNIQVYTNRINSLTVVEQILITLRFYATGSFQILIGDDCNIHKTTVCRVIQKITREIAKLCPQSVQMPRTDNEIRAIKEGFYNIRGFPNVIRCLDGSHIPIQSPGGENAEIFLNRKGYFSVNVQAVCDSKLIIRDIVARWPGSTHDGTIFNASLIAASLERGDFPGGYLLGDSAYSCKEYLLTPLLNPLAIGENNCNTAHIATRNVIERTFGVWKRRFACLSLGLRTKLNTSLEVIVATAVLHNMAILKNDGGDFEEYHVHVEDIILPNENNERNANGNALRQSLIENYFR